MREVAAACPAVQCVIAGEGSQKQSLEEEIRRAGLTDTVHLSGFRADAQAIIAAGDLFVMPSRAEPFGLVLLEAMALGRPIIATRAGGPMEIVADGATGLLTRAGDASALAAAIAALLDEPERRAAMGRCGRERYEKHFTADRMAREIAAIYRRVLRAPEISAQPANPPPDTVASL